MSKKIAISIIFLIVLLFVSGCVKIQEESLSGGVFKSIDGAGTWEQKIALSSLANEQKFLDDIETTVLVFDPQASETLYLGTKKQSLFVSFDGTESWQRIKKLPQKKINAVAVDPKAKHIVYVAIKDKIFKTSDANRTWEIVYLEAAPNVEVSSLAVNHLFSNIVIAGLSNGKLIRSEDGGKSWTSLNNFEGKIQQILINPYNPQIMYITPKNNGIFRSYNQGADWQSLKDNLKSYADSQKVSKLIFNPNFPDALISISECGILQTQDGGQNWSSYKLLASSSRLKIYSLAINPQNPDIIYYATANTLYKSIDNGENWITKSMPGKWAPIEMLVDPVNPDILYLGMVRPKK